MLSSCCCPHQTYAADEAQRPLVLEVLDAAVQLHLTVVRAWAFNDGAEQWQSLQTEPGVLRFFDFVLLNMSLNTEL